MTRSEIDDIFASKGKSKAIQQPISSSSALPGKKKQDKKRKRDSAQDTGSPLPTSDLGEEKEAKSPPKKRPAPETVIDPSTRILSAKLAKSDKSAGGRDAIKGRKTDGNSDKDNEERFKDSRGSGPRKLFNKSFLALCTTNAKYARSQNRGRLGNLQGRRTRDWRQRWW